MLAYLLAMEGSNKTPYEPNNKKDATRHLRAMEGSSNKTPYEPTTQKNLLAMEGIKRRATLVSRTPVSGAHDPESGASRPEHSAREGGLGLTWCPTGSRADNDWESGLGLAWRPTVPVVVGQIGSTPASVSPPPLPSRRTPYEFGNNELHRTLQAMGGSAKTPYAPLPMDVQVIDAAITRMII